MTTWIFQGNPRLFDVDGYLANHQEVLWGANQGHTKMKAGDRVYFWRALGDGLDHPGIIASGILTEDPRERVSDAAAQAYWKVPNEGERISRQVAVRIDVAARKRLLPAVYLSHHPELRELEILKVPNATNFRVSELADALEAEWASAEKRSTNSFLAASLHELVSDWRQSDVAQAAANEWIAQVGHVRPLARDLFAAFLSGKTTLAELKEAFDRNTRLSDWQPLGLGGPNAAMVLNKWAKHFPEAEMTEHLLALFPPPADVVEAEAKLRRFAAYLQAKVDADDVRAAQSGVLRMQAFASAVWHLLAGPNHYWPTYYTSARDKLTDERVLLKRSDKISGYFEFRALLQEIQVEHGLSLDQVTKILYQPQSQETAAHEMSPFRESDEPEQRVWLISPGEGGRHWETWQKEGIAAIDWNAIGDLTQYGSLDATREALTAAYGNPNPINDGWACFEFAHAIRPGDLIIAKAGRKRLLGCGRVTSAYRYDPHRQPEGSLVSVEWTKAKEVTLPEGEHFILKTLTQITKYPEFVNLLLGLLGEPETASAIAVTEAPAKPIAPYTVDDAAADLFLERAALDDMLATLRRKKNVILQGPPGVGKTFVAKRLAYLLMQQKAKEQVMLVQFHQSYSYEDFVQGFRPTEGGGFKRESGPFLRFCARAQQDPHSPYVLIIDEINRGNVSRIFGELLMLLEADKRGSDWGVQLAYGAGDTPFHVPPNLHVIGTMNTADRSLALVDYALRRRFAFFDILPGFESPAFLATLKKAGVSATLGERIQETTRRLNALIVRDPNLGSGYQIGHSYFCNDGPIEQDGADWLNRVLRLEIEPLLREYWRDAPDKLSQGQKLLEDS